MSDKPHALWKGAITLGKVEIPVSLQRAVRRRGLVFREMHDEDGGRIRRRAVCAVDGAPVARGHVVKGFEVERGRWVTVTDEELHALDPAASRALAVLAFVDPHEIDPIYYEATYWLVPEEGAAHACALLGAAMARCRRAALARLVLRARQHLALIRPVPGDGQAGALYLSTLGYADEIIPPADLPGAESAPPSERELLLAERLVEALSDRFRPERHHDARRSKVLAYLQEKASGGPAGAAPPEPPPAPPPISSPPLDLVGALTASVAEAERHRPAA
jgi:DNA end-binding protein Ku